MEKMFSIIMPVWNRTNIVKRAIDSVLAQDFKDYELHIVDDGSDDNLYEVVSPYLSENIFYHKEEHKGASHARNVGIKHANGKYVAYLDSDNVWHKAFLSSMHKVLLASDFKCASAYCKVNCYKKEDNRDKFILNAVVGDNFNIKKLVVQNYIDLNAFVHSKKCVDELEGFDENLKRLNDWDLILKITTKYKPIFINKVLVDYFYGVADNTITDNEDFFEPHVTIQERYIRFNERSVSFDHDAICYRWDNVPEKKYLNWVKMHKFDYLITPDYKTKGMPYILQIEPTNRCNLSCALCPSAVGKSELNRDRRDLKFEEFKAIIDDMQDYLLFLVMWDWGEPLMNQEFPDMVKYATDKGLKTVTSTNAHFLQDKDYTERLLKAGLSTLIVAIDSLGNENYKVYRKGGNLEKVIKGLKNVVEAKKKLKAKTNINLRMVLLKNNEHELPKMRKFAKKCKVDMFTVKAANPTLGKQYKDEEFIPDNPEYRRYEYKPGTYERIRVDAICNKLWFIPTIHSNGNAVACCYDYNDELIAGNVFETPLSELWNSKGYQDLRKLILTNKDSVEKCRKCNINFKLSKRGWFIEVHDYHIPLKRYIKYYLHRIKGLVSK